MFISKALSGQNQFWRYISTTLIVIGGYFIGQIPLGIIAMLALHNGGNIADLEKMDFLALGINQNFGLILILCSFIVAFIALWITIVKIHKRPLLSVITSRKKIDLKRVGFAALIWLILGVLMESVFYYYYPDNYTFNLDWSQFIPLLIIAIFIIPIQTSFEELFIRGYLMQGFGILTKTRIIPLIITSIIFGIVHGQNPEIKEFGLGIMMLFYITFGVFLGIITLLDEGLEIPLGIHAINNIYGAVIVTFAGSALKTSALFKMHVMHAEEAYYAFLVGAIIFTIIFALKYKWKNWKELLH